MDPLYIWSLGPTEQWGSESGSSQNKLVPFRLRAGSSSVINQRRFETLSTGVYIHIYRSSGGSGSSGGSVVVTLDCETAVLGSNSGLPCGMALTVGCLLRGGRGEYRTIGTSVPPKKLRKKNISSPSNSGHHPMLFGGKYLRGIRVMKKICLNAKEKRREKRKSKLKGKNKYRKGKKK
jgi:hypothetical protein